MDTRKEESQQQRAYSADTQAFGGVTQAFGGVTQAFGGVTQAFGGVPGSKPQSAEAHSSWLIANYG